MEDEIKLHTELSQSLDKPEALAYNLIKTITDVRYTKFLEGESGYKHKQLRKNSGGNETI